LNTDPVLIDTYEDLTSRPAFQPSLTFQPNGSRRFGTVIAPYRFLEKIHCGIASCHKAHLTGYLITTSDGLETAIGGYCGKNHFGLTFTREKQRIDQAVARRRRINSINGFLNEMSLQLPAAELLANEYQTLQELKIRLQGAIDVDVFHKLKRRAEAGNTRIEEPIPMTAAEAEAYFETNPRKPGDPWPTKLVHLATLDGLSFLKARLKDMLVTNYIQPMRELSKTSISDIEAMSRHHLHATAKWVGEVRQHRARAEEIVEAGKRFFSPDNLEKLVHLGAKTGPLEMMIKDLRPL